MQREQPRCPRPLGEKLVHQAIAPALTDVADDYEVRGRRLDKAPVLRIVDDMVQQGGSLEKRLEAAAQAISGARFLTAFTGAGISVESGIPSFRGKDGLWSRYDPKVLEIDYFAARPRECWPVIREIFYDHFLTARPNRAHLLLARLEERGLLKTLITQNIDDLHHQAGSRKVVEYHGNSRTLRCTACDRGYEAVSVDLKQLPPRCSCGGVLKPDFVFFGEAIPPAAVIESERAAGLTDVMILIGTTGEVYPAAGLPRSASARGATIIEINPEPSLYTNEITDIFLQMPAGEAAAALQERLERR
ncbi:MAG TPA: NAD-dependent deacylase [Spirochaetia bacterium]|nr:NAD-dependent deacylase [Spirochaetia bacterium]